MMNAIGMIETKGLLAAIEGADVMLKAADVTLLDKSSATGGLITITVTGEVSAVQAAIESATASINRLNPSLLISKHVIARPSTSLEYIISTSVTQAESTQQIETVELAVEENPVVEDAPVVCEEPSAAIEDVPAVIEETSATAENAPVISEEVPVITEEKPAAVEVVPVLESEPTPKSTEEKAPEYSASELQRMNLKNLREIANALPVLNTKVDIKKATKKTLIKFIRESQTNQGRK